MPRFHFKLQKVLEAKISFEDAAKRAFAEARRELTRQELQRDALLKERDCLLLDMKNRRQKLSTVQEFIHDIQYEWSLKMRIRDQLGKVDKAHKELEKKRKKLTEAMKERKIMEKLREKKYQYFQDEVKTEEFNFADDIAGRKAFFGKDSLISGD